LREDEVTNTGRKGVDQRIDRSNKGTKENERTQVCYCFFILLTSCCCCLF